MSQIQRGQEKGDWFLSLETGGRGNKQSARRMGPARNFQIGLVRARGLCSARMRGRKGGER